MSRNKKVILTVALLIIIALSFLLFFGIGEVEKTQEQIVRFVFIIIDEVIVYGAILWATRKKCSAFSNIGVIGTTSIYTIISLIFNLLFIEIFKTVKNILVFNFSILLLFAFILTIVILLKKENVKYESKK